MSVRRILICSSALVTSTGDISNVGDEALTDVLMQAVTERTGAPTYATLNTRSYPDLALPDRRVPVRPLRRLVAEIRAADLVIAGGGTLLQEDRAPRFFEPSAGLLRYIASVALLARAHRKPFMLAGIGAEGLDTPRARRVARFICRSAAAITVRDEGSANLVQSISGRTPILAADPMFLQTRSGIPAARSRASNEVFVNLTPEVPVGLLESLVNAIRPLAEQGVRVTLVPMDRRIDPAGDSSALHAFARAVASPKNVAFIESNLGWRHLLRRFGEAQLCIGMRLHFMIFASLNGVPLLPVIGLPKTRSLAADLGLESVSLSASPKLGSDDLFRAARVADPARIRTLSVRAERTLDCVATLFA
jgi:polysaccharide pyruvyl transferase WcaK-like protein